MRGTEAEVQSLIDQIIANYIKHYSFPLGGESHMRDCIAAALDTKLEGKSQPPAAVNESATPDESNRDDLLKAANEVLKYFMPQFPDSRAVDDCLVKLASAVLRNERATPMIPQTECDECPAGNCSDCPRKPAHEQWPYGVKLHDRIQALVAQHGSLRSAGRVIRVDHAYLKRLCDGEKTNPSKAVLRKLSLVRVVSFRERKSA